MKTKGLYLILIIIYCNIFADITVPTVDNNNTVNYYYQGESLKKALTLFANANNMRIRFSENLKQITLIKKVRGKFTGITNEEVLNNLAQRFGFEWFIYADSLYITTQDFIAKSIEVSSEDISNIQNALASQKLIIQKFGYLEMPSDNKILITGPEEYVNLVLNQIKNLNVNPVSQQFGIYHLKYANATDLQFTFNKQQITIPGVATILQSILSNSNNNDKVISQITEPIQNNINAILSTNQTSNNSPAFRSKIGSNAVIQADNRLNTIIIRDKSPNLKIYKQLIELLDIPAPLIQIEVLMLNLDEEELKQKGINWGAILAGSKFGYNADKVSNNPLQLFTGTVMPGTPFTAKDYNVSLGIQFLENNNIVKSMSKPSIVTIDNIPAIMSTNETMFINVPPVSQNNNQDNQTNIQQAQTNTSLSITPHVIFDENNKKQIKLAIALQDGRFADQTLNARPTTIQGTINSQAVINEGQSLVLAGYTNKVDEKVVSKVPVLGDIPLLGWFFKSSSIKAKQITTIYLITPKIIWLNDMKKLNDYILINGKAFNINDAYEAFPNKDKTAPNLENNKNTIYIKKNNIKSSNNKEKEIEIKTVIHKQHS